MIFFMALAFAALGGVVGLSVDYGSGAMDLRLLQNATDAAAVSATIAMVDDPTTVDSTIALMISRNQVPAVRQRAARTWIPQGVRWEMGVAVRPLPTPAASGSPRPPQGRRMSWVSSGNRRLRCARPARPEVGLYPATTSVRAYSSCVDTTRRS